jgi:hypothetical protein
MEYWQFFSAFEISRYNSFRFSVDANTLLYKIRDNGFGKLAKRWDHLITIKLLGDGKTQYTDQVDIEAGRWTLFLWLVSHLFLYHRQHRWQTLVKHHFEYVKIEVV